MPCIALYNPANCKHINHSPDIVPIGTWCPHHLSNDVPGVLCLGVLGKSLAPKLSQPSSPTYNSALFLIHSVTVCFFSWGLCEVPAPHWSTINTLCICKLSTVWIMTIWYGFKIIQMFQQLWTVAFIGECWVENANYYTVPSPLWG